MTEERVERRLAAILAADVVGYSRLMEADELGTRARFNRVLDEIVRRAISKHRGRLVKTMGDGLLVEFGSVVDAVQCAIGIQKSVSTPDPQQSGEERLLFRIGVHVGDVIVEGDDIHGDGVNIAARLEGLAEPGAVCVSRSVYDQVTGKLATSFDDLGDKTLKNISRSIRVYQARPDVAAGATEPKGSSTLSPPERPSIACLPFQNLGQDSPQNYPADAIRFAIQASLVLIPGLFVIAPPVMNQYRNREVTPDQVAKDMGVRYVLEGGCQQTNDRIRITAQLTDTTDGRVVWAERYDRAISDTLTTQDEITANIVTTLDVKYLAASPLSGRTTIKNLDALHAFYRGLNYFYSRSKEDSVAAMKEFEIVVRLQPDSPVGAAYLSMIHLRDVSMGWTESKNRSLMQAVEWAEKAVEFEIADGLAHIVLANVHLINRQHVEALSTCRTALEIRPNCPMANFNLANILHYCGHSDEAVEVMEEAIRISPVHPSWFQSGLAAAYRGIGEVEKSIDAAKMGVKINSTDLDAHLILCGDYMISGFLEEAKSLAREIIELDPKFSLDKYADTQPYKNEATLNRLIDELREVGLPA